MEKLSIKIEVQTDEALKSIQEVEKALARLNYQIDNIKKRFWLFRLISGIRKLFKK